MKLPRITCSWTRFSLALACGPVLMSMMDHEVMDQEVLLNLCLAVSVETGQKSFTESSNRLFAHQTVLASFLSAIYKPHFARIGRESRLWLEHRIRPDNCPRGLAHFSMISNCSPVSRCKLGLQLLGRAVVESRHVGGVCLPYLPWTRSSVAKGPGALPAFTPTAPHDNATQRSSIGPHGPLTCPAASIRTDDAASKPRFDTVGHDPRLGAAQRTVTGRRSYGPTIPRSNLFALDDIGDEVELCEERPLAVYRLGYPRRGARSLYR